MEKQPIRYHEVVQKERFETHSIRYNELVESPDAAYAKIKVSRFDAWRLLQPYISERLGDQLRAVLPLSIYLILFQLIILRQPIVDAGIITAGLIAVMIGLMLFIEGLKLGLMPFGETIGNKLPQKSSLPVLLGVTFLLGIGVTFAEPSIGALKEAGANVVAQDAPYLYAMLNIYTETLVLMVGVGVGLAALIGTLRFIYDWSIKPLIFASVIPTLALTVYVAFNPELSAIIGLAWDSGAVTTGPVTVPLVLALGIGIAAAAGSGKQSMSGFGIVTLASLFPILAVLVLGIYVQSAISIDEILAYVSDVEVVEPAWYQLTPSVEIINGLRAIVPLIGFLGLILVFLLREKLANSRVIMLGLGLTIVGMIIFNLGLSYGLALLGTQTGSTIPAAFAELQGIEGSPFYWYGLGIAITLLFAYLLGFGSTLAEPALNALGMTVETLTNGAFKKQALMYAVAVGVGAGIALGVAKIIFDWSLIWLILPGYVLAMVLTLISDEKYVNIAWDSAGVTTGPVTVPLVLAMGLGLGLAVGAVEGFGILALASIGPIITVQLTGLAIRLKVCLQEKCYQTLNAK
ncbi:DUF1538 domain-containing protein [Thiomicrospira microaerophila]|uniref:DUF1538 domain-containing protein n=1 Tax=Thiomicrospira microaerophila TaxID=406020 RepID=UPI00200F959C|nr:DUF1538 domain-containing protein [Thiomicrospira microaerophila]UQB42276.1 DUF1538 domain-containing protein [Thiomicrospira microaerophila]